MRNKTITILVLITTFILSGCGGGKEMVELSLSCDNNANSGNAVVVNIYQLTSADKFQFSGFESLTKNPEAALGTDLVPNSKFERTMVPGETFNLEELEIKEETSFLGIIADFHSPAPDGWKQIISLEEDFDVLMITLHEKTISVKTED